MSRHPRHPFLLLEFSLLPGPSSWASRLALTLPAEGGFVKLPKVETEAWDWPDHVGNRGMLGNTSVGNGFSHDRGLEERHALCGAKVSEC